VSNKELAAIAPHPNDWHGDWNYTLGGFPLMYYIAAPNPATAVRSGLSQGQGDRTGWRISDATNAGQSVEQELCVCSRQFTASATNRSTLFGVPLVTSGMQCTPKGAFAKVGPILTVASFAMAWKGFVAVVGWLTMERLA